MSAQINELGARLAAARLAPERLANYPSPPPQNLEDAYLTQNAMIKAMGLAVVGWKIGATSQIAREMLDIDEPFSGPLFENFVKQSPATLDVDLGDLRIVEAEIGFCLKDAVPPRNKPYSREEVVEHIASVHPVFEVVNKRLPGDLRDDPCWLVADGGVDHAFIYGPGKRFDYSNDLATETVEVKVDGKAVTEGIGANALGDPLNVVLWLANHLSARNIGLKSGDWISTGLISGVVVLDPGSTITAQFKNLGFVSLNFS